SDHVKSPTIIRTVALGFPSAIGVVVRGVGRAIRARPAVVALVAVGVVTLDVLLPPLVLSVARAPWTFFTFNPWLKSVPAYLASSQPWSGKPGLPSRGARLWGAAHGPHGRAPW